MTTVKGTTAPATARPTTARGRRRKLALMAVVFGLAVCAVLAEIGARLLTHVEGGGYYFRHYPLLPFRPDAAAITKATSGAANSTYIVRDAELGWSIKPGGKTDLYSANSQGVRGPVDVHYGPVPAGKTRIVTVGDSFTHCDEVRNHETWQHYLQQLDPTLEVLNLGGPGYGTDQALLRWRRDGKPLGGQIVLLGIWPENICRNLNLLRYYLVPHGSALTKPRFIREGEKLVTINYPTIDDAAIAQVLSEPEAHLDLLRHEYWYRPDEAQPHWHQASRAARVATSLLNGLARRSERDRLYSGEIPDGLAITADIAELFAKDVREAGATPVVLVIPMYALFDRFPDLKELPLSAEVRRRGVEVIDLDAHYRALPAPERDALMNAHGHFSPQMNEHFARRLAAALQPYLPTQRERSAASE